jgi:hypothetical protein
MVPCLPRAWIASVKPVCSASVLGRKDRDAATSATSATSPPRPWRRWWQAALRLVVVGVLGWALAGCGAASGPPQGTLLNALALQIQLTQADVARALGLSSVGAPLVSRVRVERQEPVTIGDRAGLRLEGRFDWRLGKDPFRVDAPFEIFLERGSRGESWRLARPAGPAPEGAQEWLTYPLPLRAAG